MTQLRKMTLDEIARRNYTESTTRAYLRVIEDFARYFHRPPDQLGPEQIREYTAHLFRDRKLSDNTVNQRVGALRFFFLKTLKRPWTGDEMPYPKKRIHLPVIWSPEEVACLIDAAPIPFYRTILMTLYGTGVRRSNRGSPRLLVPRFQVPPARRQRHCDDRARATPIPSIHGCSDEYKPQSGRSLSLSGALTVSYASTGTVSLGRDKVLRVFRWALQKGGPSKSVRT